MLDDIYKVFTTLQKRFLARLLAPNSSSKMFLLFVHLWEEGGKEGERGVVYVCGLNVRVT